ncbi:hypothetical protein [Aureibaculum luteum]|uniref:hypothetical protein n=1 Tax=Aureibaculum luteum TaxID=1548456 RepID=UPI000E471B69|nr:hypothetical protein [Aureibaculum luteum]
MEIIFSIEPEFLEAELSGSFTQDAMVDFLKQLGTKDSNKILIDASELQNTNLSYELRFDITNISVIILDKDTKFAVVRPAKNNNNFIIDNLQRLGYSIQIFSKKNKAKQWLLKK